MGHCQEESAFEPVAFLIASGMPETTAVGASAPPLSNWLIAGTGSSNLLLAKTSFVSRLFHHIKTKRLMAALRD
jgi:hypothetical protein